MSYTKNQIISAAFEEIGLASYDFDLQPEQLQSALRRLDTMVSEWAGNNIYLGFPIHGDPTSSSLSDDANVPDYAVEPIITNLAVKIAPAYGKQVSNDTRLAARRGYATLVNRSTSPVEMQWPSNLPMGAGNRKQNGNNRNFFPIPVENNTNPESNLFLNLD
jgi:hypothetical protein